MFLVLVIGFMLVCMLLVKVLFERFVSLVKSFGSVIVLVMLVLFIVSWINWGFGFVVGVLFVKVLVRKVLVDYWLLVVSVYLGFIVWYGGLVGFVFLIIVMLGYFLEV